MRRARGVTLVELIVVMMLAAILGGTVLVFFRPATEAYFDSRRRADLSDMADTALRRMAGEGRSAVPNSVQTTVQTAGTQCFRFVRSTGGGRYRKAADVGRGDSKPLDLREDAPEFDIFSPLLPVVGDWLVIGNQTGSDVYAGHNRAAITAVSTVDPGLGTGRVRIAEMHGPKAPFSYAGGRFVTVPRVTPVVTYTCDGAGTNAAGTGTGTLRRVSGDFDGTETLTACPTGGDLLARHVSACRFVYSHGVTQQNGFVWMELELAEAHEKIRLAHGTHVVNLP
ncbi:MAG: type II secretion system GspH family protein [Azoarcus sp.]|jgi:MSHA biogenesis protein MshO|nr:type II secretion system GspH family protein [Azoarcus sp.]